jgi:putative hydrolase of the HAD superfamily
MHAREQSAFAHPSRTGQESTRLALETHRLKVIVFDVDGTLYRQAPLRRAMLLRLLRAALLNPPQGLAALRAIQAYRRAQELLRHSPVEGSLAAAQIRLACERSGMSEQTLSAIISRWMDREPLALLEPLVEPALHNFLRAVRGRGMRLGVLSDYPAAAKLEAMRIAEFFEVVVSAQDEAVNRFKPHPSGLLEALRRLGASPDEAIYVGDRRDVDGLVARAAGVRCIILDRRSDRKRFATKSEDLLTASGYGDLHAMLIP